MQQSTTWFWFWIGIFCTCSAAVTVLLLIWAIRQWHKSRQKDIYPAVGWQTSALPGPRPPISPVKRVPVRLVEVREEQSYAALQTRAYARCLETLLTAPGQSEDARKGV